MLHNSNYHAFALIGHSVQTASSQSAEQADMQLFGTCLHCFVAVIETARCDCPTGIVQSVLRLSPHESEASRNSASSNLYYKLEPGTVIYISRDIILHFVSHSFGYI
jgi:hypothetical protein